MFWMRKKPTPSAAGEETTADRAGRLFDDGMNCTQSVLQATTGVSDPQLLEMAEAFGGGVGDSKCLCGAVTGGVMALGLSGRGKLAGSLVAFFRQRNKVTCCASLSAKYRWMSSEHLANCRRLTVETAAETARLLGKK